MLTFFLNLKLITSSWLSVFAATATTYEPFSKHPGCSKGSFLGFPTWYKYLKTPMNDNGTPLCNPAITGINDFWLIGLAVIEILLRVAILVAIIYVMIGGFKFVTARGEGGGGGPDKLNSARNTTIDALIGLVIAIIATAGISYIAGKFSA